MTTEVEIIVDEVWTVKTHRRYHPFARKHIQSEIVLLLHMCLSFEGILYKCRYIAER